MVQRPSEAVSHLDYCDFFFFSDLWQTVLWCQSVREELLHLLILRERCTGAGQDSAESGHAYWCDLCGSSMMKRSAGEACDPPEQVTFPSDRQTLTLTFVYCSTSTCWDVIIHLNISGKVPQCHSPLTDPHASRGQRRSRPSSAAFWWKSLQQATAALLWASCWTPWVSAPTCQQYWCSVQTVTAAVVHSRGVRLMEKKCTQCGNLTKKKSGISRKNSIKEEEESNRKSSPGRLKCGPVNVLF